MAQTELSSLAEVPTGVRSPAKDCGVGTVSAASRLLRSGVDSARWPGPEAGDVPRREDPHSDLSGAPSWAPRALTDHPHDGSTVLLWPLGLCTQSPVCPQIIRPRRADDPMSECRQCRAGGKHSRERRPSPATD